MSESHKFKTVSIIKPLHSLIEEFIKNYPEYRSIPDFVSEAVRLRMQELTRTKELSKEQLICINEMIERGLARERAKHD